MEKSIWFKRKTYGWGWTPANAIGWGVTAGFILAISIYPILSWYQVVPMDEGVNYAVTLVLTIALIGLCWWKGESPKWSWGKTSTTE